MKVSLEFACRSGKVTIRMASSFSLTVNLLWRPLKEVKRD
ncbi:unnamed protein product, partial [Larinioides sclopetarius]